MLEDLRKNKRFHVRLVNTSRGALREGLISNLQVAMRTLWAVLRGVPQVDVVSFHASDRGMTQFAPLVLSIAKVFRKRTIFRLFGGSFGDFYLQHGVFLRWFIRLFVFHSDVVLLQTKRMIRQLTGLGCSRLVWFSTYILNPLRPDGLTEPASDSSCVHFVFLGHLWRTKGIGIMLESATQLPNGVTIDLYGPLDEYYLEDIERRGVGRVRYAGFLSHTEIDKKLWDYDCLVLPTFHPGEGYPGVLAEAFAHGLPVITTNWMAIPECVDESCGILVEPNNTPSFINAVRQVHENRDLWHSLRAGAQKRAQAFDHFKWARRFEELCEEIC